MNCSRTHSLAYDYGTPVVVFAFVLYYQEDYGQGVIKMFQAEGTTYSKWRDPREYVIFRRTKSTRK